MCFYSQPNLPAHPRSRRLARKIHAKTKTALARSSQPPVITTVDHHNRSQGS